jgi:hypothetical protein
LIAPPLHNAHWGHDDQAEIDSEMVAPLRFVDLLRFGKFLGLK